MGFALGPLALSAHTRLEAFESIGSTNAEAVSRARAGERGPLWFVTDRQTSGRGRRDRAWQSPPGNLAASILEVMDVAPAAAATLGFAAGVALEGALQAVSVEARMRAAGLDAIRFALKWPNDLLAGGRKLSGILLEAEPAASGGLAVVVGIGVNVVAAPEATMFPATSLHGLGIHVGAAELFTALAEEWARLKALWDNGRGFALIRKLWLERASGLGGEVSVRLAEATVSGVFETIDDAGCLVVRTASGERVPVSAGDVYFGAAASVGAA
ncbi:MAG: biotin--[acetyl-CoA-carboxylase] ligase [Xanthobacteraceae bacterium]|nr:biotin--[acetyl-CoA-carboxylase] ligase [Xanthobacteraceae bacterium]